MEIIKHGNNYNNKTKIICDKCGCEFVCNNDEIETGYIGVDDIWGFIDCPECGNKITIHIM